MQFHIITLQCNRNNRIARIKVSRSAIGIFYSVAHGRTSREKSYIIHEDKFDTAL